MRITKSSGCAAVVLTLLLVIVCGIAYQLYADPWRVKARLETPKRMTAISIQPNTLENWPPQLNMQFPKISLQDHTGNSFALDSLRGKPSLIEIVAMSCAGCQAFSRGNTKGGFGGFPAQDDLKSIDDYFREFTGGVRLDSGRVNFVQIIIYNLKLEPAQTSDVAAWRKHFELSRASNWYVLTGGAALANQDSFKMVPGFLLLDKNLNLRYDATGHNPKHNLYTQLLPAVQKLL